MLRHFVQSCHIALFYHFVCLVLPFGHLHLPVEVELLKLQYQVHNQIFEPLQTFWILLADIYIFPYSFSPVFTFIQGDTTSYV